MTRAERLALIASLLAISLIAWATAARAAEAFHIEAGDAALTLNEFSWQSGLQLLFDFNLVRERRTKAVDGELEPRVALAAMLEGTGLVFEFINERTLAITVAPTAMSDAGAAPTRAELDEQPDENGYFGCTPQRYIYTLLGNMMLSSRDEFFCWRTERVLRCD